MPTTTLAERVLRIRELAGFGGKGRAAAFAELIGITPPSLHDLESGKSSALGKSLPGFIRIGANLEFLEKGKGVPMLLKNIEKNIEDMTLLTMLQTMKPEQRKLVFDMAKQLVRSNGPSDQDPFVEDPPKKPDDE